MLKPVDKHSYYKQASKKSFSINKKNTYKPSYQQIFISYKQ